ncbi:MAG: hypothetical protein ABI583_14030 [Betaproteobacteria bacterium]
MAKKSTGLAGRVAALEKMFFALFSTAKPVKAKKKSKRKKASTKKKARKSS